MAKRIMSREEVPEEDVERWGQVVTWLDAARDKLEQNAEKDHELLGRNFAYNMAFLCQCVLLAHKLMDKSQLVRIIRRAMDVALPEGWGARLMDSAAGLTRVPGATTINRHKLTLHAGFLGSK